MVKYEAEIPRRRRGQGTEKHEHTHSHTDTHSIAIFNSPSLMWLLTISGVWAWLKNQGDQQSLDTLHTQVKIVPWFAGPLPLFCLNNLALLVFLPSRSQGLAWSQYSVCSYDSIHSSIKLVPSPWIEMNLRLHSANELEKREIILSNDLSN